MQEFGELFAAGLGYLDQALSLAISYLSGAEGSIGLIGYLPPLLLVLLSRQGVHVATALLLAVVTLAVLRLGEPGLGLALYAAGYLVALQAFVARASRRKAHVTAFQMQQMRHEMNNFLDGLDRRSRDADRLRAIPRTDPEPERKAA